MRRFKRNSVFADRIIRAIRLHNARKAMRLLSFCRKFPGWLGGRYELKPFEGVAPGSSVDAPDAAAADPSDRRGSVLIPIAQFLSYPSLISSPPVTTPAKENIPPQGLARSHLPRRPASSEEMFSRRCQRSLHYVSTPFDFLFFPKLLTF